MLELLYLIYYKLNLIINSLGILLNIIGAWIVWKNSPLNYSRIDGGNASTDFNLLAIQKEKQNLLLRRGVYILIFGSVLQLISNFLP
jgi:hypothetical protein